MKRRLLLLVAWGSLLAAAGCGPAQREGDAAAEHGVSPAAETTYRIAVIPKGTSHQFWKSVHAGARRAAKELGHVEIIWKGPQKENDTAGQIEVVKSYITKRVDAICLAPNHSEALVDVVLEANDEGIPVVIFDSGLGQGAQIVSYVATDNYAGGELAADRVAELLEGQGSAIMLRYRAGSESTGQREAGFLERLEKKYPDVKILSADQFGEESAESAFKAVNQLLIKYGQEVDALFAVCEPNCNGTLEALEQAGLAGKVKFVAFDPSEVLIRGMETGKVHGIVLQDPVNMGYQAVKAAVAKVQGRPVRDRIPTGEYLATPENMREEKYDTLLHPVMHED